MPPEQMQLVSDEPDIPATIDCKINLSETVILFEGVEYHRYIPPIPHSNTQGTPHVDD